MSHAAWPTVAELQAFLKTAGVLAAQNSIQRITREGNPTGGSDIWTIATQPIIVQWNASSASVQAQIVALSGFTTGDATVSGPVGGPYLVEFKGNYAAIDMPTIIVNYAGLTGGTTPNTVVTLVQEGIPQSSIEALYDYQGAIDEAVDWWETETGWKPFLSSPTVQQYLAFLGNPGGGTVDLGWDGSTGTIAFNETNSGLITFLEAFGGVGAGNVEVEGDGPFLITFGETVSLQWLTLKTNNLTDGVSPTVALGEPPLPHNAPNGPCLVLNNGFTKIDRVFSAVIGSDLGIQWVDGLHFRKRRWQAEPAYPYDALLFGSLFSGYYTSSGIRDSGLYGGPLSVNVVGRQGFAETVPPRAWAAVRDYAAGWLLPFIGTAESGAGGTVMWRKGDVEERYGPQGPYSYLSQSLMDKAKSAVRFFRRQMQG